MSTSRITISTDIVVHLSTAGVPTSIDFDGDAVTDGNVSDDTVSFVLSEIQRRTGHAMRATGWEGPNPGVRAKLSAR
jgi:hypothetical protein